MRVTNRHAIYVQGYDPRGLAQYYRMFRTELRKFDALYGVSSTIGRPKHVSDGEIASWSIETKASDWQTRTTYDFLRFEDFIQRDMAMPIWRIVTSTIWIYLRLIASGTVFRFMAANWRFLTFITYPHILFWFEVACLAVLASLVRRALDVSGLPSPFDWLVTTALFMAALWALLKTTEKYTYLLYLMCDTIWTWQFSHGERGEWDARLDRFAEHLCAVARESDAQEIVLVGHSSGSFLGTEFWRARWSAIPRWVNTARASCCSRSAAIPRSSAITRRRSSSATICGGLRPSPRSTGSTVRRART